ncbi:MAG: GntR family transcriptional regulator [Comamonas sp.]|nr:GntR family transcriptional regulator [Candidatus Comamonas equi]
MTASNSLIPTRALYIEVAELLRQRIYSRQLAPGSWIDEMKMAEEFGISRTPLREALKVLASEGLVTMKVRRGAYETEVSEKDLRDVYHLLSLLESDATASVAAQASVDDIAQLQALHQELVAATSDPDLFFAVNEQYHLKILALCDNRALTQVVSDLRKLMKLNRHQSLFKTGRIEDSLQEHHAIMQAIVARQPEAARQAVRAHFANGLVAATLPPAVSNTTDTMKS